MTVIAEPGERTRTLPDSGDGGIDDVDHLICGDCFPGYVAGRIVKALCGAKTPDLPDCDACSPLGCGGRCLTVHTCALCVLMVQDGTGCPLHGWSGGLG